MNSRYEKFKQTLGSIDYQLENSLTDNGPNPALTPNGGRISDAELRRRRAEFLEKTREKVVSRFKTGIQKHIDIFETKQKKTIIGRFEFETSRNGFKDYTKEDLKRINQILKEDKVSFDYVAANYFNKYQSPVSIKAGEKENMERWTDRYLNLLDNCSNRIEEFELGRDTSI